ncbi:MAG: hypothetical protein ACE5LU_03525 [Anaerolineae bacterium]
MQQQDLRAQVEIFRNREVQIGAVVGLIVGLLVGWFVLGWWLAPVQWVDAGPGDLHPRWQQHYVAMVVDSYLLSGDSRTARARLEGFDRAALGSLFGDVQMEFEGQGATRQAQGVQQLADLLGIAIIPPEAPAVAATVVPTQVTGATTRAPRPQAAPSTLARVARVCGFALLAMLIVVGAVAGFFWYQRRSMHFEAEEGKAEQAGARPRRELQIASMTLGERATIQYQDEGPGYDQTIQIYRGDEIIGSCGLRGVSTLSDGRRVVACAAWLYEPQVPERSADTRVLASRQIYQNEALRSSLVHDRESGEVIPAEPGQTAHLEHETLEMTLRVLDVEYTDPGEEYISRLVVELEPVMKRHALEEPAPLDLA